MKIFVSKINESWIVDRFRDEWIKNNRHQHTKFVDRADIIWLIAPWVSEQITKKKLINKKVVCSIHHIEKKDFEGENYKKFLERDIYIDTYHVISKKTKVELEEYTKKPIVYIPFWSNQNIFFEIDDKHKLRKEFGLPKNSYIVGSFQRDTEGKDLISPKLIKGPDRLVKIFEEYSKQYENLIILLSGKRRQYIINELTKRNIEYKYFEMVDFEELNKLYNCLDLYVVASRLEGGPQAILECGLTKTPIISTDVGIATEILNKKSIFNMENFLEAKPDINTAFKNSIKFNIPGGFNEFNKLFENLI
jgi:glycosyltransferase involved in cell wall biosynthesis